MRRQLNIRSILMTGIFLFISWSAVQAQIFYNAEINQHFTWPLLIGEWEQTHFHYQPVPGEYYYGKKAIVKDSVTGPVRLLFDDRDVLWATSSDAAYSVRKEWRLEREHGPRSLIFGEGENQDFLAIHKLDNQKLVLSHRKVLGEDKYQSFVYFYK